MADKNMSKAEYLKRKTARRTTVKSRADEALSKAGEYIAGTVSKYYELAKRPVGLQGRKTYKSPPGPFKPGYMGSMSSGPSNTDKTKDKGKRAYTYPVGPFKPKGGGPRSRQGNQFPTMKKAKGGVNQFDIAAQNAEDKKKAGATTGATPAKRMTAFQRMKATQFEREGYAGRSLTRSAAQKKAMEKLKKS
jgi:hypothetical protein